MSVVRVREGVLLAEQRRSIVSEARFCIVAAACLLDATGLWKISSAIKALRVPMCALHGQRSIELEVAAGD